MPNSCCICGLTKGKEKEISMFRFPSNETKRQSWLAAFNMNPSEISEHSRVCSRHFLNGDSSNPPSLNLGRKFSSPRKLSLDRGKRVLKRSSRTPTPGPTSKQGKLSMSPTDTIYNTSTTDDDTNSLTASIGEPLMSDYSVHELPGYESDMVIDTALKTRIEFLEGETKYLRSELTSKRSFFFRIENISSNDKLVRFYTGFESYEVFMLFTEFLGPAMYNLNYWGESEKKTSRRCKKKTLDPLNQLFLTLVKLRLNLKTVDLAFRFGISTGLVSKYITTWVCFLYKHLQEINWTPTIDQVFGTLPIAFKEKYSSTYCIIDASEVFIETPSDLFMQSSTWSNYKHHNTAKFLVGCTPNGVIFFISPLYVGSVSDVELTKVSGFLNLLDNKKGVSVMADRGFTIQHLLKEKGVLLNIPPFLEGRKQLPANEIKEGRQIASLRIHIERAIGRIKNYRILNGTFPLTMIRLANQIVSICGWLTNFQTALIPSSQLNSDDNDDIDDVEDYFKSVLESDSDSSYNADTELTDDDDY